MKRHRNRRNTASQKLNLVALMDIFTILVFFLMVNSSDVQIKETHDSVALPASTTTKMPKNTIKLYITSTTLMLDTGDTSTAQNLTPAIQLTAHAPDSQVYPELIQQLHAISAAQGPLPDEQINQGRSITILGDQTIDYTTIQRVLASCAQTDFRDVSLAVLFDEGSKSGVANQPAQALSRATI